MKTKLHKTNGVFIITSNEDINDGDWSYSIPRDTLFKVKSKYYTSAGWILIEDDIINRLEINEADCVKVIAQKDQIDFSNLSQEDQDKINYISAEYHFDEIFDKDENLYSALDPMSYNIGFKDAINLIGDKRFTLEDVHQILVDYTNQLMKMKFRGNAASTINQFIEENGLTEKTQWECEIDVISTGGHNAGGFERSEWVPFKQEPQFVDDKIKLIKII
jgi:hypothetical protein